MWAILKDNRGFALIITVLIIAIIVTLTLQFNSSMRSELYAASNFKDNVRLGCMARSGVNCALALLFEDARSSSFDSMHEAWAHSGEFSSFSASFFDEGHFDVEINDLSGKIRINRLVAGNGSYDPQQKAILIRLFTLIFPDIEPEEAEDIADAIKDWIDQDNEMTRFGAEDSYYQGLESPYSCRNGPLESIEELLLIKGITGARFYGTENHPGLSRYLTVYDDDTGRININTVDPIILQALSVGMDADLVDQIIAYREDEKNDLSDPGWYKTALGTNEDILDPALIGTNSSLFEIKSRGTQDAMVKEYRAVVKRDNGDIRILSWKIL